MKDIWFGVSLISIILLVITNAIWLYARWELAKEMWYWRNRCDDLWKKLKGEK